jgi:enediyne biosynthesis protein E4
MVVGLWLLAALGLGCGRTSQTANRSTAVPDSAGPTWFEEVAVQVGLDFVHDSGSKGEFFMPEQIGSGAAFIDYDNDGRLDIYLVQHGGPESKSKNRLYHQTPEGRFVDVSNGSGIDIAGYGMGATVGDVNNDGLPDLLVTEYGAVHLFLNEGHGKFREVTREAGIDNARWATAASFLDYDRDGWLDLFVGNYVDYLPTHQCYDAAGTHDFCGPQDFQTTVSRLFHNLGKTGATPGIKFEDVTVASGIARASGKALGVLCLDFDGDRWPDIFVSDDGVPNRLYINQRDGTFLDEATLRGLAYNAMGGTAGNMGVALGDVNSDGWFDLFVTHLSHEQHSLWIQGPRGVFEDQIARYGLVNPAWRGTGFGNLLADFDLDGWPDLAFINGAIVRGTVHPGPRLPGMNSFWSPYAQRYQLFLNNTRNGFVDISAANPAFSRYAAVGRGLAGADYDNDGAMDLLAVCSGGPVQLFHNVAKRRGHWLAVRAIDPQAGGRDAIGAEIIVESSSRRWWRCIQPSCSYLVSHDPRAHFGLGELTEVSAIRVLWPDGSDQVFPSTHADQHLVLTKTAKAKP